MSSHPWFAAALRFVVIVDETPTDGVLSVVLFTAASFDGAFERAIELGRAAEKRYENAEARQVTWRLERVLTLDLLGDQIIDGHEVYFELNDVPLGIGSIGELDPAAHEPGQSGV